MVSNETQKRKKRKKRPQEKQQHIKTKKKHEPDKNERVITYMYPTKFNRFLYNGFP